MVSRQSFSRFWVGLFFASIVFLMVLRIESGKKVEDGAAPTSAQPRRPRKVVLGLRRGLRPWLAGIRSPPASCGYVTEPGSHARGRARCRSEHCRLPRRHEWAVSPLPCHREPGTQSLPRGPRHFLGDRFGNEAPGVAGSSAHRAVAMLRPVPDAQATRLWREAVRQSAGRSQADLLGDLTSVGCGSEAARWRPTTHAPRADQAPGLTAFPGRGPNGA